MLLSFSMIFVILQYLAELGNYYVVNNEPEDITLILSDGASEDELKTLKEQTGFSENEIKRILKKENAVNILKEYHKPILKKYPSKLHPLKEKYGRIQCSHSHLSNRNNCHLI